MRIKIIGDAKRVAQALFALYLENLDLEENEDLEYYDWGLMWKGEVVIEFEVEKHERLSLAIGDLTNYFIGIGQLHEITVINQEYTELYNRYYQKTV